MTPDDMREVALGIPPELRRPARRQFRDIFLSPPQKAVSEGPRNVSRAIVA